MAQCLTPLYVLSSLNDDFQNLKEAREHGDIAFGVLADLIERFCQQTGKCRPAGDDAELLLIGTVWRFNRTGGQAREDRAQEIDANDRGGGVVDAG